MAYLFVHFREKRTPDGEQIYFGLSRDGYHWEAVNDGKPVLWAFKGDHGVRDMTIIRENKTGEFHLFATDLSLAYGMRGKYRGDWDVISREGSKHLVYRHSLDLVHWDDEVLLPLGDENYGCLWAPDILYDRKEDDYLLHWSSSNAWNNFGPKGIYYSRTRDFKTYTKPARLYQKDSSGVIDSAMYEEDGMYYLFLKSEAHPANIILLSSESITGPFERVKAFDESMRTVEAGKYEAPTAVKTADGKWCLFIDYYGVQGSGQGYVPFVGDSLREGRFVRADNDFHFPYKFKHGTILTITDEEYARIQSHKWETD